MAPMAQLVDTPHEAPWGQLGLAEAIALRFLVDES